MKQLIPKKRFGQHFLKDPNILNKIVDEINPGIDDFIIEIGPGFGALTEKLFPLTRNFTAVEIDRNAVKHLRESYQNINIVEQDFLNVEIENLYSAPNQKLRVVGNIPYNLTSPILFKLFKKNKFLKDAVLMVQYEVAKRIIAKKDTKQYGILSVIANYFSKAELCFKISPNVFYPRPKVFSALIHLHFKEIQVEDMEQRLFISLVKAAFGKRRKVLKNSLSNSIFSEIDFTGSGIDLSLRAENLSVEEYLTLTSYVQSIYGHSRFPFDNGYKQN